EGQKGHGADPNFSLSPAGGEGRGEGANPTLYRLRRELTFVRGSLLRVIVPIEPVGALVPCERIGVKFAFRARQQFEVAAGVAPAHEPGAHPHRAGQPAMRRDVADADTHAPVARPIWRR